MLFFSLTHNHLYGYQLLKGAYSGDLDLLYILEVSQDLDYVGGNKGNIQFTLHQEEWRRRFVTVYPLVRDAWNKPVIKTK